MLCDFASLAQIRKLAADVIASRSRLHILVNNAGSVSVNRELAEDGIEQTFAVNDLGRFQATNLLLDYQSPDNRSSLPVLSPNRSTSTPNLSMRLTDRFASGVPFGYVR